MQLGVLWAHKHKNTWMHAHTHTQTNTYTHTHTPSSLSWCWISNTAAQWTVNGIDGYAHEDHKCFNPYLNSYFHKTLRASLESWNEKIKSWIFFFWKSAKADVKRGHSKCASDEAVFYWRSWHVCFCVWRFCSVSFHRHCMHALSPRTGKHNLLPVLSLSLYLSFPPCLSRCGFCSFCYGSVASATVFDC